MEESNIFVLFLISASIIFVMLFRDVVNLFKFISTWKGTNSTHTADGILVHDIW